MDFISLQLDYWDSPWQNRHAFLSELSKSHRVFFLSPSFYLVDLFHKFGMHKTITRGLNLVGKNLYAYTPPRYLPYNYRFTAIDKFIKEIRQNKIKKILDKLSFKRPILIIWHPQFTDMIGMFDEKMVIYYKYDHYAGYIGGSGEIDLTERKLLSIADIVCVTSKGLYDLHKSDCKDIHLVPNGVNFDFFTESLTNGVTIPHELSKISKPRIGYVGVINEKVDFKLLSLLCRKRPGWSIVLIGPEKVKQNSFNIELQKLKNYKNCYFLGQKESEIVPNYIKGLDICMMCYVINDWTYYGYPLKMHEYLACGKPTISADLPEVRPFRDVIKIAKTGNQWLSAIENYLKDEAHVNLSKRLKVAKANSWNTRVNKILSLIQRHENYLDEKK